MTATHPDYAVVSFFGGRKEEERERAFARGADVEFVLLSLSSHLRASRRCFSLPLAHPLSLSHILTHYDTQLAARIAVSNLHKNTLKSFSET